MKFYRYYDISTFRGPNICLKIIEIIRETPCGWWIGKSSDEIPFVNDRERWVSKTSRKKYAYPTKEEAYVGYLHRKRRHVDILINQLEYAKKVLGLAVEEKKSYG